jgi:hypothetical protein
MADPSERQQDRRQLCRSAKVRLHVGKRRSYVRGSSAAAVIPEKLPMGSSKRKRYH